MIKPALDEWKYVICDRWNVSTIANSTEMEELTPLFREQLLYDYSAYGIRPDFYIYCKVDPLQAYDRVKARNPKDRTHYEALREQSRKYDDFFMNINGVPNVLWVDSNETLEKCIRVIIDWFNQTNHAPHYQYEGIVSSLLVDWWKQSDLEYVV